MRRESDGIYQMLWDCPNCETPKLLGITHRHCPNCGAAQDPSRRYFPSDEEKIAVEDHRYVGADWVCPACDTPNSAAGEFCINCGSAKEGSREVRRRADQVADAPSDFAEDSAKEARRELAAPNTPPVVAKPASNGGFGRWIKLAVVLLILGALAAVFWKRDAYVVVSGHDWRRAIEVERFVTAVDRGWRDQLPLRAYDVSCYREVRSHTQVPDGEECSTRRVDRGDGSFEQVRECRPKYRSVPVYDQMCRYKIDRWQAQRTEEQLGRSLAETPRWPVVRLSRTGSCLGCEREGKRSERYTVHFTDSRDTAKTHRCEMPEQRWAAMADGSRWKGKARVLTGGLDCDGLTPAP